MLEKTVWLSLVAGLIAVATETENVLKSNSKGTILIFGLSLGFFIAAVGMAALFRAVHAERESSTKRKHRNE